MEEFAPEIVSIADACLGGLRGRSALLICPEEKCYPYVTLLRKAGMEAIYQEETSAHISSILPHVQLFMHLRTTPSISAASIAEGCIGRRTPLLIFDLAESTSVDELAGLLPTVCLYTPDDLRRILARTMVKIS